MSLLAVLASGAATPPPPPPVEAYETELSPTWVNRVHVGPGRTYATIEQAIAAITSDSADGRVSTSASTGVYSGGMFTITPRIARYRSVIILDPGTYQVAGSHVNLDAIDIVGATGNRDDVTITAGSAFVFNTKGDLYIGHLTMRVPRNTVSTGKSYAVHMTWVGEGDYPTNNIFENVRIIDEDYDAPGGNLGWDGPDDSYLHIKDCLFEGPRNDVLHGDSDPTGFRFVIENTTFNRPEVTGWWPGVKRWLIGCTLNGVHVADQYTDDAGNSTSVLPPTPTLTNATTQPERWTSTATLGSLTLTPAATPSDLGPVALTPGVIYYIPVDVAAAGSVKSVEVAMTTPVGTIALGLYTQGARKATAPGDLGGIYQNPAAASAAPKAYPTAHWQGIYPTRMHKLFVAVLVTDAAARVQGSTELSSTVQCYRSTATNNTSTPPWPTANEPLPAGAAVPWVKVNLY